MIVDPDFFDHWRTVMVRDALADDLAPVYIMRLWAHCQSRKADRFDIPTAGLKAVCHARGDAEALEAALIAAGYIQRDGVSIHVIGWAEKNAALIAAWGNGTRGGRPRKQPEKTHGFSTGNPAVSHGHPTDNPEATHGEPIREDKSREEKKREIQDPPIPPRGEARKRAASSSGVPCPEGVDAQHWADWLGVRKAKRAGPVTQTALDGLIREASKAGLTLDAAVKTCVERGWQGLKADWLGVGIGRGVLTQPAPVETAYARSMREKWEQICPDIAAKRPGARPAQSEIIDMGDAYVIDAAPRLA